VNGSANFLSHVLENILSGNFSTIGEALLESKKQIYGNGEWIDKTLQAFTILGDPAMRLPYLTAGVDDQPENNESLYVFPNPVTSVGTISFSTDNQGEIKIETIDIFGRVVSEVFSGTAAPGNMKIPLDASGLVSGTYYVRVSGGARPQVARFSVVK